MHRSVISHGNRGKAPFYLCLALASKLGELSLGRYILVGFGGGLKKAITQGHLGGTVG